MPTYDGLSNRAFFQCLFAFAAIAFLLSQSTTWVGGTAFRRSTTLQLSGHSTLQLPADRAIVAIRIEAEGSKQAAVSSEVRSIANEVLSYLQPLQKAANGSQVAPVSDLSFTTFETSFWNRDTILGQTKVHTVKAEIDVEFSDMKSLGVVLAKISKQPKLTVKSTKWKLSDSLKQQILFQVREDAMNDLLAKFRAFMKPLKLQKIHAVRIQEASDSITDSESRPRLRYEAAMYDVLDGDGIVLMDDEKVEEEAYTMDSRTLKVTAKVRGDFVAY